MMPSEFMKSSARVSLRTAAACKAPWLLKVVVSDAAASLEYGCGLFEFVKARE